MNSIESFKTPRLTADRLDERHLVGLTEIHLDPEVSRFLGGVRSRSETEDYLKVNMLHWDRYGFGLYAIKTASGDFAGRAGIRNTVVDGKPESEIAYTFKRSLWGQGLASEIVVELLKIARENLRLSSIVGIVELGNSDSCHVLEKAKFHLEKQTTYNGPSVFVYRKHLTSVG